MNVVSVLVERFSSTIDSPLGTRAAGGKGNPVADVEVAVRPVGHAGRIGQNGRLVAVCDSVSRIGDPLGPKSAMGKPSKNDVTTRPGPVTGV